MVNADIRCFLNIIASHVYFNKNVRANILISQSGFSIGLRPTPVLSGEDYGKYYFLNDNCQPLDAGSYINFTS